MEWWRKHIAINGKELPKLLEDGSNMPEKQTFKVSSRVQLNAQRRQGGNGLRNAKTRKNEILISISQQ